MVGVNKNPTGVVSTVGGMFLDPTLLDFLFVDPPNQRPDNADKEPRQAGKAPPFTDPSTFMYFVSFVEHQAISERKGNFISIHIFHHVFRCLFLVFMPIN